MIRPLQTFDFLLRASRLYGESTAIVDGPDRYTYSEFLERSLRLNASLQSIGLRPNDVVSVISYNTHHMLEAYYGTLKSGMVINPVNFRYSQSDILYMLDYMKSKALIVHQDFLPVVNALRDELPSIRHVVVIEPKDDAPAGPLYDYETLIARGDPKFEEPTVDEDAVAEVLFTSGTTKRPKAVGLTQRNLYLNALYTIIAYGLSDEDSLLHTVPLFHANGGGTPQTITAVGAKHVMLRKVVAEEMLRLIDQESVTIFVAVPTVIDRMLASPDFHRYDASSLSRLAVVGTALSQKMLAEIERKIPGCECISVYGMTEGGHLLATARPRPFERGEDKTEMSRLKTMTGYEVLGVQIRVVDKNMDDVKQDCCSEGEVVVRGNSVFNAYYGDKEATSAAITEGWFHTGDWARMYPDGRLVIVDRLKDMIKSGGENISSIEIEEVLKAHPLVAEAAAIGVPDDQWGEVPKAFVVPRPGASISSRELSDFCLKNLAHFKVPKSFDIVEDLPRSVNGKVSKESLRARYWSGREKRVQ